MADIKEITKKLEDGVKGVFTSETYRNYLSFMGRFHTYSINNSILIWLQKPDASLVAGYKTWTTKFKRQVRKGETGIKILAPCPHKITKVVVNQYGDLEEVEVNYTSFKPTTVFDISQTDGDEVPELCKPLNDTVDDFNGLFKRLEAVSPVPVEFDDINNGASGFFSNLDQKIVLKRGMSELQTIKTLIHEISHAVLHAKGTGTAEDADRRTREVQAESIAFTVCAMLGLDTSDYSFEYIAGWSAGQETKELVGSMEVIRKTASEIFGELNAA